VRTHRDPVDYRDVVALLRARSVPGASVRRVVATARERGYAAATLCHWVVEHDADALVLVLDAGVAERALCDHLAAGTAPDWRALEVFAEIAVQERAAGLPDEEQTDPDAVPLISDLLLLADLYDWSTAPDPGGGLAMPIASWEAGAGENWPDPA
jgi:hypothetical protein